MEKKKPKLLSATESSEDMPNQQEKAPQYINQLCKSTHVPRNQQVWLSNAHKSLLQSLPKIFL